MTDEQTPQQKQWQERHIAEQATRDRLIELFRFWDACSNKRCRRLRGCAGEPSACLMRHWRAAPEELKAWFRARFNALEAGHEPVEAARIAEKELARVAALRANGGMSGGG
jgi:hypothetical protein